MAGFSHCTYYLLLVLSLIVTPGCLSCHSDPCHGCLTPKLGVPIVDAPKELAEVSIDAYRIEPPDILLIDAVRIIPLPPYRIEPLDALFIQVAGALPQDPINGAYSIDPDGTVFLGQNYGKVAVVGMTLDEAQKTIEKHLTQTLKKARVVVSLAQSRAMQQIRGEHLVRPDGTIGLGTYGSVYVAGMTIDEARGAIEAQLSVSLQSPEVAVDVFAYNSKVYYVVFDGGGYGEQVYRLPYTGKETVLDAIGQLNGLPPVSSKKKIWLARPTPEHHDCDIMPVDWKSITQCGSTDTNYQLYPGDRIYVKADCLITFDNTLAKIISPIERLFGITLLGTETVRSIKNVNQSNFGGF